MVRGTILGRTTWRKICAVEGIVPNKETERMFEEFDRLGLSNEERRRRIIAKHLASTKK
jgi:urease accessory protein UreE